MQVSNVNVVVVLWYENVTVLTVTARAQTFYTL